MLRLFNRACTRYGLLADGDRILLGLSGGKDSLLMARLMAERARIFRPAIHVEAAHVVMENVPYQTDLAYLESFCQDLGLPLHVLHSKFDENTDKRKTRCYLCSHYRRKALLQFAQDNGFNVVALGHHQDDFITTFLLNLLYEGSAHSMQPSMPLQHYALKLIRPLCLVPEALIQEWATANGVVRQLSPCPYEDKTRRTQMEALARQLCSMHAEARQSMWHALEKGWENALNPK